MITPNQFAKQMIELQKTSFISCYEAASMLQAKAGSTLDHMLGQAQWIPSESRKIITDWLTTCDQERDRFKAYVEKSYANLGMYFAKEAVAKAGKTGKPSGKTTKTSAAAPEKKAPSVVPEKTASAAVPEKTASVAVPEKTASVAAESEKTAPAMPAKAAAPAKPPKAAASGSKPMKSTAEKKTAAEKKGGKAVLK